MGKFNTINEAIRSKIDALIEENGLDAKDYPYSSDAAESLNQLKDILGIEADYSQNIADALDSVLGAVGSGSSGGSGGDFAGLVDGTITQAHDSTVTSIRQSAFAGCSMLSDIDFPNVEIIGNDAFSGSMISAVDPITSSVYIIDARVPIVSATFPKCKTIGYGAFYNCYQLSQISFPECTTIYNGAFNGCAIKEAIFPKCVSLDGYGIRCETLEKAFFPALPSLGDNTFAQLSNLNTVVLQNCSYIGDACFASCVSLESLYVLGSSRATLYGPNAYYEPFRDTKIPTTGHIYVPASLMDSYKTASFWSKYSSRFEGLTDEEISEILGE